jgi:predicted ATPase
VVNALIEDATSRRRGGKLIADVNVWLEALGRVRLMPIRSISKRARIFEIRIKDTDSGRWANFADVGFGIGQALPVFVEGLRTPVGGTFLVQEPEINLHPDAQLAMADFLIDLVRKGRRVIVETHSEPVLLRVRHWIVGMNNGRHGNATLAPSDVSILKVDKRVDGTSHVRHLKIDEMAQIKDWPDGFMDEATEERMDIMEGMSRKANGGS